MKIFFIRHGQTRDNVDRIIAGKRDSKLTPHGVNQARRLGTHLVDREVRVTHVYTSDRERAIDTASAIVDAQSRKHKIEALLTLRLGLLQEQNFGFKEGMSYDYEPGQDQDRANLPETTESMQKRAAEFWSTYIESLLVERTGEEITLVIVRHGLYLGILWRTCMEKLQKGVVTLESRYDQYHLPSIKDVRTWENTGCYEVDIQYAQEESYFALPSVAAPLMLDYTHLTTVIHQINSTAHLKGSDETGSSLC